MSVMCATCECCGHKTTDGMEYFEVDYFDMIDFVSSLQQSGWFLRDGHAVCPTCNAMMPCELDEFSTEAIIEVINARQVKEIGG